MPPASCSGICSVSRKISVGLVLHDGRLAVDGGCEPAAQRIGVGASLVNLPDDRRRGLAALATLLQLLDLGGFVGAVGVCPVDSQRALDRHLPVAERRRCRRSCSVSVSSNARKRVADAGDVLLAELAVLLAQVLAQRPVPPGGVDQLHLAAAMAPACGW